MKNISLQMSNMNSMKMPMQNMMMNNNFNNMNGYTNKFTTDKWKESYLSFKYGITMKEIIEKFFEENWISNDNNNFDFIYNTQKINKNDMTTIEVFFANNPKPSIVVLDGGNIIGW